MKIEFQRTVGSPFDISVVADFNSDGKPDLALLRGGRQIRVGLNPDSGGTLLPVPSLISLRGKPYRAIADDFDQDGDVDLLVTCKACTGTHRPTIYMNNWSTQGRVSFTRQDVSLGLPALKNAGIAVAFDWQANRDTDILLLSTTTDATESVLLQNLIKSGPFKFADRSTSLPAGILTEVTAAAVLDVNEDRRQDIYVARKGKDLLLIQQPNGDFTEEGATHGLNRIGDETEIATADLDNNGSLDILLLSPDGNLIALLTKKHTPGFKEVTLGVSGPAQSEGLALAHVLGDRHPEIIVTGSPGGLRMFQFQQMAQGVPTYQPVSQSHTIRSNATGQLAMTASTWKQRVLGLNASDSELAMICSTSITDRDSDGIPEWVERNNGLNDGEFSDAKADPDADDVPNSQEILFGSDPQAADSDHDGISDETDLLFGTDFDGDRTPFEKDNCPQITNRRQHDTNLNRIGDLCDRDPGQLSTFQEARHANGSDYALIAAREISGARLIGDQKGLLPQGPSFKLWNTAATGLMRPVIELWNKERHDHAYAVLPGDVQELMNQGYQRLGIVGYISAERPNLPDEILVKRFKIAGTNLDHAVTSDPDVATKLLAAGYVEETSLGWALFDEGKFSTRTKPVVKYDQGSRATIHSSRFAGDIVSSSMRTQGVKFRVMPEKSGWTIPLYRFRSADFAEALSTNPADFTELERRGYREEGIIGWIFPLSPIETKEDLVPLVRLFKQDRFVHSTDSAEIARLVNAGYTRMKVLGRVVRQPAAPPAGVNVKKIYERALGNVVDTRQRAAATLMVLDTACTIERAINGSRATPFEQSVGKIIDKLDPETRARLLDKIRVWHFLDPETRRTALGSLVPLDPGNCQSPIDTTLTRLAITYTMDSPSNLGQVFGTTLRAPQCTAGTTADARAISVVKEATVIESETPRLDQYAVNPQLLGVLVGDSASSVEGTDDLDADPLFAYQTDHKNVGLPLIGVDVGPCNTSGQCAPFRGELCVEGRCRSYPFIKQDGAPTFTGVSFWDKFTSRIDFTPVGGGQTLGAPVEIVGKGAFVVPVEANLAARCDPEPAKMGASIRSPRTPVGGGFGNEYIVRPNEAFVDTATVTPIHLALDQFYEVQLVNQNSNYFFWNEPIDVAQDPRGKGHVIHLCTAPGCNPLTSPTEAPCKKNPVAQCSSTAGGVWNQQPRTLANCAGNICPETPSEFRSSTTIGTSPPLPLRVYVPNPGKKQFLNARLTEVICYDETGWDAFGEDEFVLFLGVASNPLQVGIVPEMPGPEEIADLGNRIDTWTAGFDSDDRKSPREFLSSLEFKSQPFNQGNLQAGIYALMLGEDDDNIAQLIIAGVIGAAATVGAGFVAGPIGAAGAGVLSSAIIGAIAATDPDDFLGQNAWQANVSTVIAKGKLSHDNDPRAPIDTLPVIPDKSIDMRGWGTMSHPAADGEVYGSDADLRTCNSDPECNAGERCASKVCVPQNWADPTDGPANSVFSPGHLEIYSFNGSGARYSVRFSFSVSDRQALPHER
jgi:hypothetical protein